MRLTFALSAAIGLSTTMKLPSVSAAASACVEGGFSLEFEGECKYETVLYHFESLFNNTAAACPHGVDTEIRIILGLDVSAEESEVHAGIRAVCQVAWDSAEIIPFDMTHMKGPQFSRMYYNGGTEWNEEVETNLESRDGSHTHRLREDASVVKDFYDSLASHSPVEWPNDLPNFELSQCTLNAAMCCWPKDRQANDGNGNCATPYDENCYDKDPADNTDLCFVDLSRALWANQMGDDAGFVNFPHDNGNGEGAIHCHGFAWGNDKYDFTARYKANNLFYVSMYDHMYQRGYVENIPGSPMCACVEQMPTVTRSDCTQIDVQEKYTITYYPDTSTFTGKLVDIDITFNSCRGRYNRNNDLHAYVARLAYEGKLTPDQRAGVDKYLVGNGRCGYATDAMMEDKRWLKGYNHDSQTWFQVAGHSDTMYTPELGREAFRSLLADAPYPIVKRVCATCIPSHQYIYYKRLTPVPAELDLMEYFLNGWKNQYNAPNVDFQIFSTFEDAVEGVNPWTHYEFNGDRGFPYESGPNGKVRDQWRSFSRMWGRTHVGFYVMKGEGTIERYTTTTEGSGDDLISHNIGNPIFQGGAVVKDGTYYVTGVGYDIWNHRDEAHFLNKLVTGGADLDMVVYISSLRHRNPWTKAGLMIRESLDDTSKHFFCLLSGNQGVMSHWRESTGSWTSTSSFSYNVPFAPVWLKVTRRLDTFECHKSSDGETWELDSSRTFSMSSDPYYAGMAITSHESWWTAEAVFENFEVYNYFYPSASPTISRSPNLKNLILDVSSVQELDGIVAGHTKISVGKPATQSSTAYSGVASRAVDGNRDGNYGHGSTTHSSHGDCNPWWKVDLSGGTEEAYSVSYVAVFNRQDCCSWRLYGFYVELLNDEDWVIDSVYFEAKADYITVVQFFPRQDVTTVRIRKENCDVLQLAEVEVYAV